MSRQVARGPLVHVRVWVDHPHLGDVGGTAVLAKQECSFAVGEAVFDIHVVVVFGEGEDETPLGAALVLGDWGPESVDTVGHRADILPELIPGPSGCCSRSCFVFGNVVVVRQTGIPCRCR